MKTTDNTIKLRALEFSDHPFRKLRGFRIEFADRLTVIAGHNGIGKSTILGLIANTFGLTSSSGPRSYVGDLFFTSIERIVYLALTEVEAAQANPAEAPVVIADVHGTPMKKRCALTRRDEWQRARVVPRTVGPTENDIVGPDAKIPLPTIYLGIRRLAPIGEAGEKEVQSRELDMHDDDNRLMQNFVSDVILGVSVNSNVTYQSIKGSLKKTAQPGYQDYEALAVSLGQDSLGSIATALASFNRLKREMGDQYPGGLLVVDELDAGFHPHAIGRLVKSLKTQANRLQLQIAVTTHSPRLIEAVHPDGDGNYHAPDKVIYLLDTRRPCLAEDQSLRAVLSDMTLRVDDEPSHSKPVMCAYFEDEEGMQFFEALFPVAKRAGLGRRLGVQIKLIPLGVGGSHLVALPSKDPIFKERLLIVDADTKIPKATADCGNAVKLPCADGAFGTDRSPENTIRQFLLSVAEAADGPLHNALRDFKGNNWSTDKIRAMFFADGDGASSERNSTKAWWKKHWPNLQRWGVISAWAKLHHAEVNQFLEKFEKACTVTAKKVKLTTLDQNRC